MSGISIRPYFTACQNSVSEHSFAGVPASLLTLTKRVPDPSYINRFLIKIIKTNSFYLLKRGHIKEINIGKLQQGFEFTVLPMQFTQRK